jgi:hypothetical protein
VTEFSNPYSRIDPRVRAIFWVSKKIPTVRGNPVRIGLSPESYVFKAVKNSGLKTGQIGIIFVLFF